MHTASKAIPTLLTVLFLTSATLGCESLAQETSTDSSVEESMSGAWISIRGSMSKDTTSLAIVHHADGWLVVGDPRELINPSTGPERESGVFGATRSGLRLDINAGYSQDPALVYMPENNALTWQFKNNTRYFFKSSCSDAYTGTYRLNDEKLDLTVRLRPDCIAVFEVSVDRPPFGRLTELAYRAYYTVGDTIEMPHPGYLFEDEYFVFEDGQLKGSTGNQWSLK